jgi:hypothetical protein
VDLPWRPEHGGGDELPATHPVDVVVGAHCKRRSPLAGTGST